MLQQIKVYITAKREHGQKILAAIPDGIHMNARWPYMLHTPDRPVTHYLRENFDDCIASNAMMHYIEPGDSLELSLLEIGNALAFSKKIFIACDIPLDDGKLPHKMLHKWIAFDGVRFTGTQIQTYNAIKKEFRPRLITNNDGSIS